MRFLVGQASAGCGKTQNSVILSEAKNLSLFFLLYLNRREILRFAQNDRVSHFFRRLFSLPWSKLLSNHDEAVRECCFSCVDDCLAEEKP
jgi:hypothetical protein